MIKVLVVEDTPVVREYLVEILSGDPQIKVIGAVADGQRAVEAAHRLRPNVITMDIHMPGMDGLEATRRIMETCPTPIVVVSGSSDAAEVDTTFRAMEAGAVAVLRRPAGVGHPDYEATARELVLTVKLMSEVKVVRRWPLARRQAAGSDTADAGIKCAPATVRVIAIGASTGGPPALDTIVAALPKDLPVPVLIVQHMTIGFVAGFVEWLARHSRLPVHLAAHAEYPLPGHIYVAPDEFQMKVDSEGKIVLARDAAGNGLCPSVSCLFRSLAEVYGGGVVAGLLSGMGRDGAEELKLLRDKGAITFAQDKDSSVVHGMPGEAIRLDAAALVLPPDKIAAVLTNLVSNRKKTMEPGA